MKKTLRTILALVLVFIMAFTLVACNPTKEEKPTEETPSGETPGGETPGGETPGPGTDDEPTQAEGVAQILINAISATTKNCTVDVSFKANSNMAEYPMEENAQLKINDTDAELIIPEEDHEFLVDGAFYTYDSVKNIVVKGDNATAIDFIEELLPGYLSLVDLKAMLVGAINMFDSVNGCSYNYDIVGQKVTVKIELAEVLKNILDIAGASSDEGVTLNKTLADMYYAVFNKKIDLATALNSLSTSFTEDYTIGELYDALERDFYIDLEGLVSFAFNLAEYLTANLPEGYMPITSEQFAQIKALFAREAKVYETINGIYAFVMAMQGEEMPAEPVDVTAEIVPMVKEYVGIAVEFLKTKQLRDGIALFLSSMVMVEMPDTNDPDAPTLEEIREQKLQEIYAMVDMVIDLAKVEEDEKAPYEIKDFTIIAEVIFNMGKIASIDFAGNADVAIGSEILNLIGSEVPEGTTVPITAASEFGLKFSEVGSTTIALPQDAIVVDNKNITKEAWEAVLDWSDSKEYTVYDQGNNVQIEYENGKYAFGLSFLDRTYLFDSSSADGTVYCYDGTYYYQGEPVTIAQGVTQAEFIARSQKYLAIENIVVGMFDQKVNHTNSYVNEFGETVVEISKNSFTITITDQATLAQLATLLGVNVTSASFDIYIYSDGDADITLEYQYSTVDPDIPEYTGKESGNINFYSYGTVVMPLPEDVVQG